jgi:hypothetical protein
MTKKKLSKEELNHLKHVVEHGLDQRRHIEPEKVKALVDSYDVVLDEIGKASTKEAKLLYCTAVMAKSISDIQNEIDGTALIPGSDRTALEAIYNRCKQVKKELDDHFPDEEKRSNGS